MAIKKYGPTTPGRRGMTGLLKNIIGLWLIQESQGSPLVDLTLIKILAQQADAVGGRPLSYSDSEAAGILRGRRHV